MAKCSVTRKPRRKIAKRSKSVPKAARKPSRARSSKSKEYGSRLKRNLRFGRKKKRSISRRRASNSQGLKKGRKTGQREQPFQKRRLARILNSRYFRSKDMTKDLNILDEMEDIKLDRYIRKVLRKHSPKGSMTKESATVMDRMMKGVMHEIGKKASGLMGRKKVLKPKVIRKAVKQIMPDYIRLRADRNGKEALERWGKSWNKFL